MAPEFGWDDYKGVDVKGKTIVMLINDPAVPDASDPAKLDDKMFKGKAMTYYGRWTYKYEIASRRARRQRSSFTRPARLVIRMKLFREVGVARTSIFKRPTRTWVASRSSRGSLRIAPRNLFTASGQDFDALKKAAVKKDFKPVALNAKANMTVKNTLREINSANVVGKARRI